MACDPNSIFNLRAKENPILITRDESPDKYASKIYVENAVQLMRPAAKRSHSLKPRHDTATSYDGVSAYQESDS